MNKHNKMSIKSLCIILLICLFGNADAQSWPPSGMQGNGTQTSPWEITSAEHLEALASYVNAGNNTMYTYYKMMNDINLTNYPNWIPIGQSTSFNGNFDGNGKVIQNLHINSTLDYCGLFGRVMGAIIQNIGIVNCNINGGQRVGGLIGKISNGNEPRINNCYVTGSIKGTSYVGGLIGDMDYCYGTLIFGCIISNCYTTCNVESYYGSRIGGLIGSFGGIISNCYATGNIKGYNYVGGLVGCGPGNEYNIIRNCIAVNDSIINTSSSTIIGRILGSPIADYNPTLQNNYALGTMIVQNSNGNVTVIDGYPYHGIGKPIETLQNLSFYSTSSNWYGGSTWSITDPYGIWKICNGIGLPFLRWQGLECTFPPVITTTTLPNGIIGTTYSAQLIATGNMPITWSLQSGSLPNGLNLSSVGVISGTPSTAGTSNFTIKAENSAGSNTKTLNITVTKAQLAGTVSIIGNVVFGQTLTANTSNLTSTPTIPNLGTLTYQWKRGISNIGTNSATYTLVQADIGSTITVTVIAANCNGSKTSNSTATVAKATQTAPSAPTLKNKTTTSITLNEISGCEYNRDGGNWQATTIFSGLTPNTFYSFKARKTETTTHLASPQSSAVTFKTDDEVGIDENEMLGITVYPNPTIGKLRIENGEWRIDNVEIFDIYGRKQKAESKKIGSEILIDISHLSAGIYFLRIRTEQGDVVRKVLKE